jgi:hypothetical protein
MDPRQSFEREALGGAAADVEHELWAIPTLVLLAVDVEGHAGDLAE